LIYLLYFFVFCQLDIFRCPIFILT